MPAPAQDMGPDRFHHESTQLSFRPHAFFALTHTPDGLPTTILIGSPARLSTGAGAFLISHRPQGWQGHSVSGERVATIPPPPAAARLWWRAPRLGFCYFPISPLPRIPFSFLVSRFVIVGTHTTPTYTMGPSACSCPPLLSIRLAIRIFVGWAGAGRVTRTGHRIFPAPHIIHCFGLGAGGHGAPPVGPRIRPPALPRPAAPWSRTGGGGRPCCAALCGLGRSLPATTYSQRGNGWPESGLHGRAGLP